VFRQPKHRLPDLLSRQLEVAPRDRDHVMPLVAGHQNLDHSGRAICVLNRDLDPAWLNLRCRAPAVEELQEPLPQAFIAHRWSMTYRAHR
jgi:hypothetical protein